MGFRMKGIVYEGYIMPMTAFHPHSGLDLTWRGGAIDTIVRKRLRAQPQPLSRTLDQIWPAAFFGLDRVDVFRQAEPALQRTVLAACARLTIEEGYFIEKAGVSFMARMTLLARSVDERSLYALFGAEEANHLALLQTALGEVDEQAWQGNPFLTLLGDLTDVCDRLTGQLVIQTVLEGWGLTHYASLREACLDAQMSGILNTILIDEAGHHGSALVLLDGKRFDADATRRAVEPLAQMLSMVQMGPAMVMGALERALGGFTTAQRETVYAQLDGDNHARIRLSKLRALMEKVRGAGPVVEALAARKLFSPQAVAGLT